MLGPILRRASCRAPMVVASAMQSPAYLGVGCRTAATDAKPGKSDNRGGGGGGGGAGGFVRTEAGLNELYMRAVEPKPTIVPVIAAPQAAVNKALADTYTKLMWKRRHVMNRDLQRKLKLKWAAIAALPTKELKLEALTIDPYVPLWYRIPAVTPPLKGFHAEATPVSTAPVEAVTGAPRTAKAREEKRKADLTLSLAASIRRGRGRDEDEEDSLFGFKGEIPTPVAAPTPTTSAPVAASGGKKKKK